MVARAWAGPLVDKTCAKAGVATAVVAAASAARRTKFFMV
jgi:hypothetical protein